MIIIIFIIIIVLCIILLILFVLGVFIFKLLKSGVKELSYVDYKASMHDEVYKSIIVYLDTNKLKYVYKDGHCDEIDITYEVFNKINEIFLKYDVFNWNSYNRDDFEVLDDDDVIVYYKFSNGDAAYADIQVFPKGKKQFFYEFKDYLLSLK